jgi:hypothetical protein
VDIIKRRKISIRLKYPELPLLFLMSLQKNGNSEYSNHTLNTGHTYATITDIMNIIIKQGERGNT